MVSRDSRPGGFSLLDLPLPEVECEESSDNYGCFVAQPLAKGFGVTLGNALRRVLLSSLAGAAVTWVRIEGIQHAFTVIPYVKEDVIEFLLNVKELRIRSLSKEAGKLILEAEREGEVCAGEIRPSADFEIVNPELHLITLDSPEAKFYAEFNVEIGRGYVPAGSTNGLPLEALPVDAIFTPVYKANFSVEPIHPGQETSQERLKLEVWTDNTISPWQAVSQSAAILMAQFSPFRQLAEARAGQEVQLPSELTTSPDQYNMPLEQLNLSTRSYNALRRANITTMGQLLEASREGLPPLPGFGAKSRTEVEELIRKLGFPVVVRGMRGKE